MSIKKMSKEELESLSNKDLAYILIESDGAVNTADLFKKIISMRGMPDSVFEEKIGDFYTSLSTDKRFLLLEDGKWDLRMHHTSDKLAGGEFEEDDEEDELEDEDDILDEEIEDDYGDGDEDVSYDDTKEDLKDLVVLDDEDMELEQ